MGVLGCMNPVRVVVIDDDPSHCKALERLISSAGYDVETFGSGNAFLDGLEHTGPACVVLDLKLPDHDGLELFQSFMEADPRFATIFLTGFANVPTSVEAIKSGAVDFLEKPVQRVKLLEAIENAVTRLLEGLEESERLRDLEQRYDTLTPRERQVMKLIVGGLLNKQIAVELGISTKTVKVHRGRVMTKIGARRLPHLMMAASHLGLVNGHGFAELAPQYLS